MKTPARPILPRPGALLAALLALSLGACSTVDSRIRENPQIYAALTPRHQALVRAGQVENGMPQDAVYLAWGRPDFVTAGQRGGRQAETWYYYGTRAATAFGFAGAYGCGPCSVFTTAVPVTVYEDYLRAWAAFENRSLVAWEKARP